MLVCQVFEHADRFGRNGQPRIGAVRLAWLQHWPHPLAVCGYLRCLALRLALTVVAVLMLAVPPAALADMSEVVVVSNTNLKPVQEFIEHIKKALGGNPVVISPETARSSLEGWARQGRVRAVVALGADSINASLMVPENVPLIYGLVLRPVETGRRNITGIYMTTPIKDYVAFFKENFPQLRRIGIVHEPGSLRFIESTANNGSLMLYSATNSYEFVKGVKHIDSHVDVFLLMPEKDLISRESLNELFIYSFAEKVPVIGISEKYVKTGSLMCLVFDIETMGRQLGDLVKRVLKAKTAVGTAPSSPGKLNLYINERTANSMNIRIPPKVRNMAAHIYR